MTAFTFVSLVLSKIHLLKPNTNQVFQTHLSTLHRRTYYCLVLLYCHFIARLRILWDIFYSVWSFSCSFWYSCEEKAFPFLFHVSLSLVLNSVWYPGANLEMDYVSVLSFCNPSLCRLLFSNVFMWICRFLILFNFQFLFRIDTKLEGYHH